MKIRTGRLGRLIALLLVLMMVSSLLPIPAFAESGSSETNASAMTEPAADGEENVPKEGEPPADEKQTKETKSKNADVNVWIKGRKASYEYSGEAKTLTADFTFTAADADGAAIDGVSVTLTEELAVSGTDAGEYYMGLEKKHFNVTVPEGYTVGKIQVDDGCLTIHPAPVTVNITGKQVSVEYSGAPVPAYSYDVSSSHSKYSENDFIFLNSNTVRNQPASGEPMGLSADMFQNINRNFTVTFNVIDGWIEIHGAPPTGFGNDASNPDPTPSDPTPENKTELTIAVNNATKTYGDPDPEFTVSVTGLKEGHKMSPVSEVLRTATGPSMSYEERWWARESVGEHIIVLLNSDVCIIDEQGIDVTGEYAFGADDFFGKLTIVKRKLSIKVEDAWVSLANSANFLPSCSAVGLVGNYNGDNYSDVIQDDKLLFTINGGRPLTQPGTYEISAVLAQGAVWNDLVKRSSAIVGDCYNITITNGTLTVTEGGVVPPPPLPGLPGDLVVMKTVAGDAASTTQEFRFTVELSDKTINSTYGGMTFTNGVASFTLKHGESKRAVGLQSGITYAVTEEDYTSDGYVTTKTGDTGAIVGGGTQTAAFTNTKGAAGSLEVNKSVYGGAADENKDFRFTVTLSDTTINGTYGEMTFENGVATFTLKGMYGSHSKIATGLPVGTGYTVAEDDYRSEGYSTDAEGASGTITEGTTQYALFNNRYNGGYFLLQISKILAGVTPTPWKSVDANASFPFTLTLYPPQGEDSTALKKALDDREYNDVTYTENTDGSFTVSFTLKEGRAISIYLPLGTLFTFTETSHEGCTVKIAEPILVNGTYSGEAPISDGDTSGILTLHDARWFVVYNTPAGTGDLTVGKTVVGEGADLDKEFGFTVTLSDTTISGTYGDMTFENGVATFTLKHGESKTATGLPEDITYEVTEEDYFADAYVTTMTGDTGSIIGGETATAAFTNTKITTSPFEGKPPKKRKQIDWLGDDGNNPDTTLRGEEFYRLYLDLSQPEALQADKGLDLIYIMDHSGSIGAVNLAKMKTVLKSTYSTIAENLSDVRVSLITFATTATQRLQLEKNPQQILNTINSLPAAYGNTNLMAGLEKAYYDIAESQNAGRDTVVFVVSDGYPNVNPTFPSTSPAYPYPRSTTGMRNFFQKELVSKFPKVVYSSVYVGSIGLNNVMSTLHGNGGLFLNVQDYSPDLLEPFILKQVAYLYPSRVVVSDRLSPYVQIPVSAGAGADYRVTMTKVDTGEVTVLYEKGGVTASGEGKVSSLTFTPETGSESTGTVKLTLEPTFMLDPAYRYTLSFNVELTDKALEEYEANGYGDTVGDEDTDYSGNKTSSGKPGFHSNHEAGVTYTLADRQRQETFPHPVVQAPAGELKVSKTVVGEGADPDKAFSFMVQLMDDTITGEYGDMSFTKGEASFTLKHGESKTATGLPKGITYHVWEYDYSQDGYIARSTGDNGSTVAGEQKHAEFRNMYFPDGYRYLSFTKRIVGEPIWMKSNRSGESFSFALKLWAPEGENNTLLKTALEFFEINYTENADGSLTATFTLEHGNGLSFMLPPNVRFQVTETSHVGFTVEIKEVLDEEGEVAVGGDTSDVLTLSDDRSFMVYNTRDENIGDLKVSKTVVGEGADLEKEFNFKVTVRVYGSVINGTYGDMTFNNDVATFTLKHGESKTATGLPALADYYVEEEDYSSAGYFTKKNNAAGRIIEKGQQHAEFWNMHFPNGFFELHIYKRIEGAPLPKGPSRSDKRFSFALTLYAPEDGNNALLKTALELYGINYTESDDGNLTATFGLNHGDSIIITLPAGTRFKIAETSHVGYSVQIKERIGVGLDEILIASGDTTDILTLDKNREFTVWNQGLPGELTISKTLSGNDIDRNKYFSFTINLVNTYINGVYSGVRFVDGVATITLKGGESKTIGDLPTGIPYEVTEADYTADGYVTTKTGDTGTIVGGEKQTAAFTNTRNTFGNLVVTKTVEGNAQLADVEFRFTVTLSDKTINGEYGDMSFTNGIATFTLKHGESKEAVKLPNRITYAVTEDDYTADGYVTTKIGASGTIVGGETQTAAFTNTRNTYGSLVVTKTVEGNAASQTKEFRFTVELSDKTINGEYGDMSFAGGVATFTLKHGESKEAVNLPNGITYEVTEADYAADGYVTAKTGDTGTIVGGEKQTAAFTNTRNTYGNLVVTKTVEGNAQLADAEFRFTVTLSDKTINGTYGEMSFAGGVATFTLKHDESKKATGLPNGITYEVTEADYTADGYVTTKIGDTGTIVGNDEMTAAFVNTRNAEGSLTVSKTVEGNDTDSSKAFTFTITLSEKTINKTYSGVTFTNGVATITLKDGESKTIEGLPHGVGYEVTEADYSADGYVTAKTGDTGTIDENTPAVAKFTNIRNTFGALVVMKTVEGNAASETEKFEFTVELSDKTINGIYGSMSFTNGVAHFNLEHTESKKAVGLPNGITYVVTEEDYSADGYVTMRFGDTGTIVGNNEMTASFVNTRNEEGNLTVRKTLAGNDIDRNKEFSFTITLSDKTINGEYSLVTFTNGVGTFTLKGGASKTIGGLPNGVGYEVTEADYSADGYVTAKTGDTGTIAGGKTQIAVFTNTRNTYGDLVVTKTVAGNAPLADVEFIFTVTLSDNTINGTYGEMSFAGGVATFTLKHGESKEAVKLPNGITYAVTEDDYTADGYVTTKTGASGTIVGNDKMTAAFVNTRNAEGSLTVKKTVTGDLADKDQYFNFTITFNAEGSYSYTGSKSGTIKSGDTVQLKHSESITISGLPAGTTYAITESGNYGYRVYARGDKGTIAGNATTTAAFTNAKSSVPQTSDDSNLLLWLSIAGISGVCMVLTAISGKKRKGKHISAK